MYCTFNMVVQYIRNNDYGINDHTIYLPCFDHVTHWLPLGIPQLQGNSHSTKTISHLRVQINQYYISTMSNILFKSLQ